LPTSAAATSTGLVGLFTSTADAGDCNNLLAAASASALVLLGAGSVAGADGAHPMVKCIIYIIQSVTLEIKPTADSEVF
jgi:hypothetical protein